jgi:hypothetical protein
MPKSVMSSFQMLRMTLWKGMASLLFLRAGGWILQELLAPRSVEFFSKG